MWLSFFCGLIMAIAMIYIPGFLFFRILGKSFISNIALAPIYSLGCFFLIASALDVFDLKFSVWAFVVPTFLIALGFFIFACALKRVGGRGAIEVPLPGSQRAYVLLLCAQAVIGVGLLVFIFVRNEGGPLGFSNEYDNYFHLNAIRYMLDPDIFNGTYYSIEEAEQGYPLGWHLLCALVVSLAQCPVTVGVNAVNVATAGVVFPVSMFYLVTVIFKEKEYCCAACICSLGFVAFPWNLLVWGPVHPNLFAFALVPLSCALLVRLLQHVDASKQTMIEGLLLVASLAILARLHPNAVFVVGIFAVPLVCNAIVYSGSSRWRTGPTRMVRKSVAMAGVVGLAVIAWCALYKAPFMQKIVQFDSWEPFVGKSQALMNVLFVGYDEGGVSQLLLAAFIVLGILHAVIHRRFVWLLIPYAVAIVMYVFGCTSNGWLRHFLTGFWYGDNWRIGAVLALFAIPVAVMGCAALLRSVMAVVERAGRWKVVRGAVAIPFAIASLAMIFWPSFVINGVLNVDMAFSAFKSEVRRTSEMFYDSTERAFVEEVSGIVGNGLVLNDPYDGSAFLGGVNGVKVFFPEYLRYDKEAQDDVALLREHLDEYGSNEEVQALIESLGVEYLLLLDDPNESTNLTREWDLNEPLRIDDDVFRGSLEAWQGFYDINDATSGFELVLEHGDMKLFRLVRPES